MQIRNILTQLPSNTFFMRRSALFLHFLSTTIILLLLYYNISSHIMMEVSTENQKRNLCYPETRSYVPIKNNEVCVTKLPGLEEKYFPR